MPQSDDLEPPRKSQKKSAPLVGILEGDSGDEKPRRRKGNKYMPKPTPRHFVEAHGAATVGGAAVLLPPPPSKGVTWRQGRHFHRAQTDRTANKIQGRRPFKIQHLPRRKSGGTEWTPSYLTSSEHRKAKEMEDWHYTNLPTVQNKGEKTTASNRYHIFGHHMCHGCVAGQGSSAVKGAEEKRIAIVLLRRQLSGLHLGLPPATVDTVQRVPCHGCRARAVEDFGSLPRHGHGTGLSRG
ncbi:hypothetical protein B0H16DRAFT_1456597 [Mycena metata]|uniref:Uncharacterized protein n=1 Tax=Mycena metata TaxID=1033252 RepID=A0AAD7J9N0_9AGAR|nr:hypothetical protein B0H16DRAFT_1456597 [Mycena metata]